MRTDTCAHAQLLSSYIEVQERLFLISVLFRVLRTNFSVFIGTLYDVIHHSSVTKLTR